MGKWNDILTHGLQAQKPLGARQVTKICEMGGYKTWEGW